MTHLTLFYPNFYNQFYPFALPRASAFFFPTVHSIRTIFHHFSQSSLFPIVHFLLLSARLFFLLYFLFSFLPLFSFFLHLEWRFRPESKASVPLLACFRGAIRLSHPNPGIGHVLEAQATARPATQKSPVPGILSRRKAWVLGLFFFYSLGLRYRLRKWAEVKRIKRIQPKRIKGIQREQIIVLSHCQAI